MYRKIHFELEENSPVVGYNTSGESIKKKQLLADLLDAEKQIEKGEYMTLDELNEDSKTW